MIAIGSDHGGFEVKQYIIEWLIQNNIQFIDFGTNSIESVDYPDYAHKVVGSILDEESIIGILICGTGNGISMAANRWRGIRAALCWNTEISKLSREHNDANVLSLPGRFLSKEESIQIVDVFLDTEFEGGRHISRINKIDPRMI